MLTAPPKTWISKSRAGFTLAELLIALAITGAIAAFTIPKIVGSVQSYDYKNRVQIAAAMMQSAYAKYREDNQVTGSFKAPDLTPYLNYTQFYNASQISVDGKQNTVQTWPCNASDPCVRLANGSTITLYGGALGSIGTSNAIIFIVDPDGRITDGTTTGPGRSVELYMYATNGRVADIATIDSPTHTNGIDRFPTPTQLPSWFSWN